MDIVYAGGKTSVADVLQALPDPPSYSAVRALMRILEEKGHLKHVDEAGRYVYQPTRGRKQASRSAIHRLLKTFFDGSAEQALAALLDASPSSISEDELTRMAKLIDKARKEGR